jgi:excisionase family DNA binding protein
MRTRSKVLTVREAAELLQFSEYQIRCLLRSGKLPGFRFGRRWRIDADRVYQMISGSDQPTRDPEQRGLGPESN